MKLFRMVSIFAGLALLGGCSTTYGPMGLNGGYKDERVNSTTYYLLFKATSLGMGGGVVGYSEVESFWNKRAEELCGSQDFYADIEKKSRDAYGNVDEFSGTPMVYGIVYCNNKFVDTRKQAPDENFKIYEQLSIDNLQYKETSPLWSLLIEERFEELEAEIALLIKSYAEGNISETNLLGLLGVFSRVNPALETHYKNWQQAYPSSYMAFWAEGVYYHNYAWSKRDTAETIPTDSTRRAEFYRYRDLAENSLERAIEIKSDFCLSYYQLISLQKTKKGVFEKSSENTFEIAKDVCPASLEVYRAYLTSLLPRWKGSMQKMRSFIDESEQKDSVFKELEAVYLLEEGNMFLQDKLFEKALEKYQAALKINPDAVAYRNVGLAQESLSNYVEAIKNYRTAVAVNPYFQMAYLDLYRVLSKQGDYLGALSYLTHLTALNNQVPEFYVQMGNMFYDLRLFEEAIISYKKALVLDPESGFYQHRIRMSEYQIKVRESSKNESVVETAI